MKIIVDAMGGDHAPLEIVKGAVAAARKRSDLAIVLVGKEDEVKKAAAQCGGKGLPGNVSIVNATEVIDMHDDPATAFKTKKDSSVRRRRSYRRLDVRRVILRGMSLCMQTP